MMMMMLKVAHISTAAPGPLALTADCLTTHLSTFLMFSFLRPPVSEVVSSSRGPSALLRPLAGYGVPVEAVYHWDSLNMFVCVSSALIFLVKDATQSRQVQ